MKKKIWKFKWTKGDKYMKHKPDPNAPKRVYSIEDSVVDFGLPPIRSRKKYAMSTLHEIVDLELPMPAIQTSTKTKEPKIDYDKLSKFLKRFENK